MKDGRWKKDETPYLIFQCSKCYQYSYVKTTQNTKKCLRCNRTHQVQNLLGKGEIVKGMAAAVGRVKMLQNELARNKLGRDPDLVSEKGFSLPQKDHFMQVSKFTSTDQDFEEEEEEKQYPAFLTMLYELNSSYKNFPLYLINIMADEKGIPQSVIPSLIRKATREKKLKKMNDLYTYIS
jgi:hypothetical protein